jgi:hypothetical protein
MGERSVEVQAWVKQGCMLVNTSALDPDHEMHPYNQIVRQGERPEDFGVHHPYTEMFKGKARGELCAEIVKLRQELEAAHRIMAMI